MGWPSLPEIMIRISGLETVPRPEVMEAGGTMDVDLQISTE